MRVVAKRYKVLLARVMSNLSILLDISPKHFDIFRKGLRTLKMCFRIREHTQIHVNFSPKRESANVEGNWFKNRYDDKLYINIESLIIPVMMKLLVSASQFLDTDHTNPSTSKIPDLVYIIYVTRFTCFPSLPLLYTY